VCQHVSAAAERSSHAPHSEYPCRAFHGRAGSLGSGGGFAKISMMNTDTLMCEHIDTIVFMQLSMVSLQINHQMIVY
jgi:hypothetical protein